MKLDLSVPNVFGGIMCAFLAIIMIRITYPITSALFDLWIATDWYRGSMMRVTAILIEWIIYFFVLYVLVWMGFLQPKIEKDMGKTGMTEE